MGKESRKIPLVSGLIGRDARSIHGQMEVSLIDYNTLCISIWREAYCGLSNVSFSIRDTDLQDIIDLLIEAKNKADSYWLAKVAVESQRKKIETVTRSTVE
ncbi:MAG: hypothetical protein PVF15_04720 [Candidatus Bathyarchaeota archaeon]|jgi:hypothetical protein